MDIETTRLGMSTGLSRMKMTLGMSGHRVKIAAQRMATKPEIKANEMIASTRELVTRPCERT